MAFNIFKNPEKIENEDAVNLLFENRIRQLKVVTYGFTLALSYSIFQFLTQPGIQLDYSAKAGGIAFSWLIFEFFAGKHFINPVIDRKEKLSKQNV